MVPYASGILIKIRVNIQSIQKQWMNEALSSDENSFAYSEDTRELSMNQLLKNTRWFTWYHVQQWMFVCSILSFKIKLPKRSRQFSLVSDGVNYNRLSQLAIQFRKSSGLSSTCLFQSRLVNSWNQVKRVKLTLVTKNREESSGRKLVCHTQNIIEH